MYSMKQMILTRVDKRLAWDIFKAGYEEGLENLDRFSVLVLKYFALQRTRHSQTKLN